MSKTNYRVRSRHVPERFFQVRGLGELLCAPIALSLARGGTVRNARAVLDNMTRTHSHLIVCIGMAALGALGAHAQGGTAPPNGFVTMSASGSTTDVHPNYGTDTRMTLDANGDPVVAFLWQNPSGNGDYSDTTLYVSAWSRTKGSFLAPVKIEVTGDIVGSGSPGVSLSIAHDTSSNRLGLAYRVVTASGREIHFAISQDDGATWNIETVATTSLGDVLGMDLGMALGVAYAAYGENNVGIVYLTAPETAAGASWKSTVAPIEAGYSTPELGFGLALDGNGTPVLAYALDADNSADVRLEFWRLDKPTPSASHLPMGTTAASLTM